MLRTAEKAEERAQANGRDFIELSNLCITGSIETMIDKFKKMEKDLGIDEILEYVSFIPPVKKNKLPKKKPGVLAMKRINELVDLVF